MNLPWFLASDGAVEVALPCSHVVLLKPEWVAPDGHFLGRLACTVDGCRHVLEDVVLDGWANA